jgi:murein DD-endopeptidase MepM/ murein hydrolase activator NlpD
MDEENLLSGRRVHEGEVIGQISNFSIKEGGTSYHLHFDVQVPTKDGWVFVNPYMTLVAAYERLIGERGTELGAPMLVSSADADLTATIGRAVVVEPINKRVKAVRHARHKAKAKKVRTRVASH